MLCAQMLLSFLYCLGAMFTVDYWLHWSRQAMCVVTSFTPTGIDKGINSKEMKHWEPVLNKS